MVKQSSTNPDLKLDNHFNFGDNWRRLVKVISEDKLKYAIQDIQSFMAPESISGKSFLDIGCGSGLHAVAAWRLGAREVTTVDLDPKSLKHVQQLKKVFNIPDSFPWTHYVGNIASLEGLDNVSLSDVVYSWGVLHHTGDMWSSINNASSFVKTNGYFYIMIYRDAYLAPFWKYLKKAYTFGPSFLRLILRGFFVSLFFMLLLAKHRSISKVKQRIRDYDRNRGMSWYIDIVDWIGGYPFEWASASQVCDYLASSGFKLQKIYPPVSPQPVGLLGTGSYQYLFAKH
jgi:SAM-dependent methyltransferase